MGRVADAGRQLCGGPESWTAPCTVGGREQTHWARREGVHAQVLREMGHLVEMGSPG